jgi:methylenetetrahydrofolate dehydrogenase (NADP+)/methenyltetrahydrofolate cyclohydrolase
MYANSMSAMILDGRKIRDEVMPDLAKSFANLGCVPVLTIIQVGNREDTNAYIRAKKLFAEKLGVKVKHIQLTEDVIQDEVINIIKENNQDSEIKGIIVQLPLPVGMDVDFVINSIDPKKDVDAITSYNVKQWIEGEKQALLPATARGVRTLLRYYNIDLSGKKVVVIGRSALVGKPIACMCSNEKATVTVCHSKTLDLAKETLNADIIISAVGKVNLITKDHVKAGQIVVDVGINTVEDEKLYEDDGSTSKRKIVGDVDFEQVSKIVQAISPVPGGVGPLTVLSLFQNLLDLS